jgi:hypothetical protein
MSIGDRLYILYYKKGMAHVRDGFVLASSLNKAREVGKAWCNSSPACRFVNVIPAVVADESILEPAKPETPAEPEVEVKVKTPVDTFEAA